MAWACVGLLATGCVKDSEGGDGDGAGGDPGQTGCEYQGMTYPEGAQVPAGDGCNTCQCEDGMVGSCTEIDCRPPPCTDEAKRRASRAISAMTG